MTSSISTHVCPCPKCGTELLHIVPTNVPPYNRDNEGGEHTHERCLTVQLEKVKAERASAIDFLYMLRDAYAGDRIGFDLINAKLIELGAPNISPDGAELCTTHRQWAERAEKQLAAERERAEKTERERDDWKAAHSLVGESALKNGAMLAAANEHIAKLDREGDEADQKWMDEVVAVTTRAERYKAALEFCRQRARMTPDSNLAHFVVCQVDEALAVDRDKEPT
jgi:hypothetical protein